MCVLDGLHEDLAEAADHNPNLSQASPNTQSDATSATATPAAGSAPPESLRPHSRSRWFSRLFRRKNAPDGGSSG